MPPPRTSATVLTPPEHSMPNFSRPFVLALSLLVVATFVACGGTESNPTTPAGDRPVEMHVRWELHGEIPATITIHEPPADQRLYEVHTYLPDESPDVGEEIPAGILRGRHSEPERFIALIQNHGEAPLRFWVAPHLPVPHVTDQGLMMFCLCTGEVYEVPAGGSWTRVMEFGVTRRAGLEGPVILTHVIVAGDIPPATPVPH